ncbi:Calcium/calmodulin-dependent 3',5'-cyclic nucleotide phosphodiesterase 1B, partial [Perkinsus olseni]
DVATGTLYRTFNTHAALGVFSDSDLPELPLLLCSGVYFFCVVSAFGGEYGQIGPLSPSGEFEKPKEDQLIPPERDRACSAFSEICRDVLNPSRAKMPTPDLKRDNLPTSRIDDLSLLYTVESLIGFLSVKLDLAATAEFLSGIEKGCRSSNPYHNSMHTVE